MNKQTDSIIRYCKPTQVQDGIVAVSAFYLRKKDEKLQRPEDEKELSVHQYEFFKDDSLKELKEYLIKTGFKFKPEGCFAVMKYSDIEADIKNSLFINIDITQDFGSPRCLIHNLYKQDLKTAYYFVKNIKSVTKIKDL
mgnify:CR=1 FL=1